MKNKILLIFMIVVLYCPAFTDILKTDISSSGNIKTEIKINKDFITAGLIFSDNILFPEKILVKTDFIKFGTPLFFNALEYCKITGKYINSIIKNDAYISTGKPADLSEFLFIIGFKNVYSGFFTINNSKNYFVDIDYNKLSAGLVISEFICTGKDNYYENLDLDKTGIIRAYLDLKENYGKLKYSAGILLNLSLFMEINGLLYFNIYHKSDFIEFNLKSCIWSENFTNISGVCDMPLTSWNMKTSFFHEKSELGFSSKGVIYRKKRYISNIDSFFSNIFFKSIILKKDSIKLGFSVILEKSINSEIDTEINGTVNAVKNFDDINIFWVYKYSENFHEITSSFEAGIFKDNRNRVSLGIELPDNIIIRARVFLLNIYFTAVLEISRTGYSGSFSITEEN